MNKDPVGVHSPLQLQSTNSLGSYKPPIDYMGALAKLVDHPAYNAAQMIPGLNIPANALAYVSHADRGMTGDAVWDSLGMVPGVGMLRGAKPLAAMADWGKTVSTLAQNYPRAMGRAASGVSQDAANSLLMMARMTGRQAGNAAQVKQSIDTIVPAVQAATSIYE